MTIAVGEKCPPGKYVAHPHLPMRMQERKVTVEEVTKVLRRGTVRKYPTVPWTERALIRFGNVHVVVDLGSRPHLILTVFRGKD